jgi:hypothetical protein
MSIITDWQYTPIKVEVDPNSPLASRSARVRERVLDHLMERGGRVSPSRMDDARHDLVMCAIRLAKERGMRLWTDRSKDQVSLGLQSLETLLGEKVVIMPPRKKGEPSIKATGKNLNWVLDLWEVALDYHHREPLYQVRKPAEEIVPVTLEEARAMNDSGPTVVAITQPVSISSRLLDAYLARDDEAIMRLAIEVEALEQ